MKTILRAALLAAVTVSPAFASAPVPAPITPSDYPVAATARDGRHDFDFEFGTWRTRYRILKHRLAGDHEWYDCYGTSVIRPFWNGYGNLEDGDLRCPTRYVGGMTLRFYSAQTHQWTLWWGTRVLGVAPPQQVGHFTADGVGRFYAYDTWQGKPVICRFQWTRVRGNPHFEQAYSVDGGKTWETNWTTDYTPVSPSTYGVWNASGGAHDASGGFAFLAGTWTTTRTVRRGNPFARDPSWSTCAGTSLVREFWSGDADIEETDLDCSVRRTRSAEVRLYDASRRRWLLYSATTESGLAIGLPQAGSFDSTGSGDFQTSGTFEGKSILIRQRWTLQNGTPRVEEAFSDDDGKSWEVESATTYAKRS